MLTNALTYATMHTFQTTNDGGSLPILCVISHDILAKLLDNVIGENLYTHVPIQNSESACLPYGKWARTVTVNNTTFN